MNSNTPERDQNRKINRKALLAQHARTLGQMAQFEWPRPGDDLPRLSWSQYLELWAEDFEQNGEDPGKAIGSLLRQAAAEAIYLGAHTPEEHTRLAEEAYRLSETEAAWTAAIETSWEDLLSTWGAGPDPDETGGYGHDCLDGCDRAVAIEDSLLN